MSAGFADVHPSVLVTNPRILAQLENAGFSLGDVLGIHRENQPRFQDYSEESGAILMRSKAYTDLVRSIDDDVRARLEATPAAGVGTRHAHRFFDVTWLSSPRAHFELVGVVNRIDFRMLRPPGCGQTRLVYRLAYQPPDVPAWWRSIPRPETRLPLTVSVIYENREASCAELARDWLAVEQEGNIEERLVSGPLHRIDRTRFDRIELNFQSLRHNSANRKEDDAAQYVMRGFNLVDGRLVVDTLRNTPRTDLGPADLEDLREWIAANLAAIDDGSAEVPPRFLAREATSVAPRGLSRLANRPFKRLFPDENAAFGNLPLDRLRIVRTPQMLVRRLDEMSCAGCHQSRTIAGFQLLGEERTDATFNALTLGLSEHLREILDWRYRFLKAAADGSTWTEPAPVAERADDLGLLGAHCTMSDGLGAGSPQWDCAAGLTCDRNPIDGDPVGQCRQAGALRAGASCQTAALDSTVNNVSTAADFDPDGDIVTAHRRQRCYGPAGSDPNIKHPRCELNSDGFAGGMCTADCETEGQRVGPDVCARIPRKGFERECFRPDAIIEKCLTRPNNSRLELMHACSRTEPCRDDFVCARMADVPLDQGVCVPTYFLFQARVDGPPADR